MVDFLLQEGVIESLLQFVTQVGSDTPRPTPNEPRTEKLKLAYK